jgi:hypothetical protein
MVVLAVTTTTLVASGCGESKKTLTHAQLATKADAICKRVNAKIASTNGKVNTIQGIARVAPQLAAFEQVALGELGKLVPPGDLVNDWKQFIAGAQTLADDTGKLGEYAKANNLKAARGLILSSNTVQQQMKTTAKQDGWTECEHVA